MTFWHFLTGSLFGAASWSGIFKHAAGQATVGQAIGLYGLNVAAFFTSGGISQIGGISALEAATIAGAASGGIIGVGNVALQGGSFADIGFGAIQGALLGGTTAFLGGAAMMGLGGIASKIQLPKMSYANTGNGITMHPNLNDALAHYTNIILGSGSTNLYDYFIASNGTHLRVDQYMNYDTRVGNGTAPNWMIHNYHSWTRNIDIPFINSNRYPAEVELSTLAGRSIYLGDYERYGGSFTVSGSAIGTGTYYLQFDNSPLMTYGSSGVRISPGQTGIIDKVFSKPYGPIPNIYRRVHLSANGIIPRLGSAGIYIPSYRIRLRVTHASHL